jgi:RNA polymerase sigma factor (sigma-70 family)
MTDEEIINSIKMGYDAGLIELYQLNLKSIINHVKMNNGRQEDAEDVFQEVIYDFREKVIQNRFILTNSTKIKTFLFEACKRKWLNELRKRSKVSTSEVPDMPDDYWNEYEEKRELTKRHQLVVAGMQMLGEKCRRILQYYCDRIPMVEIAVRLGFEGGEQVAKNEKAKCQKKLIDLIHNQN